MLFDKLDSIQTKSEVLVSFLADKSDNFDSKDLITASTFAASAVLRIAPTFPGFSKDSATKISGFFDSFKSDKAKDLVFAIAKIPSVVSR